MRWVLPLLLLLGCTVEEWRNADLHLDITDMSWSDEDRIRICVDGAGIHEEALGAGRAAFTGISAGAPVSVTVDLLEEDSSSLGIRLGRAGPISFEEPGWIEAPWEPCLEDCGACSSEGSLTQAGEPDWLLAVRFL